MQAKRILKLCSRLILVSAAILLLYFALLVMWARSATPRLVRNALKDPNIRLQLTDIKRSQIDAILRIQDPGFYNHHGFDFSTAGTGSTTISQAMVKHLYYDNFKPGFHKIGQTLIARFAFDAMTPKDSILKIFINRVFLGNQNGKQVFGFASASENYFQKQFSQLNTDEFLSLLAMIRSPETYHILRNPKPNHDRVERIKKVLSGSYIPKDNSDWQYEGIQSN